MFGLFGLSWLPTRSGPPASRARSRRIPTALTSGKGKERAYSGPGVVDCRRGGRGAPLINNHGMRDTCLFYPGERYEDWILDDAAGQSLEAVRPIRDAIKGRVEELIASDTALACCGTLEDAVAHGAV